MNIKDLEQQFKIENFDKMILEKKDHISLLDK